MIRIENDIFYISAGETCYIFKIENGVPMHVYFGKRVEPEDDLSALGFIAKTPELSMPAAKIDGKQVNTEFVFESAQVSEGDESKTLTVVLHDKKNDLEIHMYYTPNSRGGIFRRAIIQHRGGRNVVVPLVRQSVSCACDGDNNDNNIECGFFTARENSRGDAYGFLCANADGNITVNSDCATCDCSGLSIDVISVACPKMLCVYSDLGLGGMSRIFHDILRGEADDDDLSWRSAVLFLPKIEDVETLKAAVKTAGELGFGIVAMDGGKNTTETIRALGDLCREYGLTPGLRVNRAGVEKGSALYAGLRKKTSVFEHVFIDMDKDTAVLYSAVSTVVGQNGLLYVMIDIKPEALRGMFAFKNIIMHEFYGVRVDFGVESDEQSKALTVCYPLEYMRNVISPEPAESFKTRFDIASLGTLGYELDPLEISDGIKRAVRAQILAYQDDALNVLRGDVYGSAGCRMVVSKDKSRAYAVCTADGASRVKLTGLDEHNLYRVRELDKTFSGAALVNCGIALDQVGTYVFHIRQVADY